MGKGIILGFVVAAVGAATASIMKSMNATKYCSPHLEDRFNERVGATTGKQGKDSGNSL